MRYQDGELIELYDDGGGRYDDEIYVKGHVSDEEATEAYHACWHENHDDEEGEEPPALGPWRHAYARWSTEHWEGEGMVLRAYSGPGRGRFKVTVAESQWQIDRRIAWKARQEAARVACLERFPGVEIHMVDHSDPPLVCFDVPGTSDGRIKWRSSEPDHVWVAPINMTAWEAYNANR